MEVKMSEVVKNQHYVPQFYLRYFANNKKSIYVYDKFSLKMFPSTPRDIASEGYFYDIKRGELQVIEKVLNKKYEDAFSNFLPNFLKKIENQKHFELKKYEKVEIATFLSYQYIRTKRFREESVRLFTSSDIYNSDPHFSPLLGHYFLLSDPMLLKNISNNLIQNYYWLIGKNVSKELFYTSDNPFVQRESLQELHTKYKKNFADFSLLSDEISFPLSPSYILTFYRKNKVNKNLRHFNKRIVKCDINNVHWFNTMQIMKSYRQIYSQNNDFSFVEKIEKIHRKRLIDSGFDEEKILKPKE